MPRKTDSNNPADWLAIAEADMDAVRLLADHQTSHTVCRSKLAEVIEKLTEDEAADDAAEEVAREVDPARRAAIGRGGTADKRRRSRLGEKRSDANQREAGKDGTEIRQQHQR